MKIYFNQEIPKHSIVTNDPERGKQWMFLGEDNEFQLLGKMMYMKKEILKRE